MTKMLLYNKTYVMNPTTQGHCALTPHCSPSHHKDGWHGHILDERVTPGQTLQSCLTVGVVTVVVGGIAKL